MKCDLTTAIGWGPEASWVGPLARRIAARPSVLPKAPRGCQGSQGRPGRNAQGLPGAPRSFRNPGIPGERFQSFPEAPRGYQGTSCKCDSSLRYKLQMQFVPSVQVANAIRPFGTFCKYNSLFCSVVVHGQVHVVNAIRPFGTSCKCNSSLRFKLQMQSYIRFALHRIFRTASRWSRLVCQTQLLGKCSFQTPSRG